jgi:hypothetical protein
MKCRLTRRASYAGYADWRVPRTAGTSGLPTGEPAEVESIWDCTFSSSLCIDPIFWPSDANYWSGSTPTVVPESAWYGGDFEAGAFGPVHTVGKVVAYQVRAARSGP